MHAATPDVLGYLTGKGQWQTSHGHAVGYCPRCQGGPKRKRCFSVNLTTGQWCCNRKNACGLSGGWSGLLELFGDRQNRDPLMAVAPRATVYTKPHRKPGQLDTDGMAFLKSRGLSELTAAAWSVGQDRFTGLGDCLTWPAYNPAGEVVNLKYRAIADKQFRNTKGAQKVPVGIHTVKGTSRLILVEGELDAMSGYQYGLRNIVSVPNGTGDADWVTDLWDWLAQFTDIVVALDNDAAGSDAVEKLVKRLGAARCLGVTLPRGHKDLNDCLMAGVPAAEVLEVFDNPREFKVADLRFASGYADELLAEKDRPGSRYGHMVQWPELDDTLRGFRDGELTVVSGYNGSGKSTLIGWWLNHFASTGVRTCVFSGELPPKQYMKWLAMQALGGDWDELTKHEVNSWLNWMNPHFCLLNHPTSIHLEKLLEVFEYAARRYQCRVFVADNLMKIQSSGDPLEAQRRVVTALKDFAIEYGVHVFLVAHPRKPPQSQSVKMTKFDISGTSDIPNLADNVLIIHRQAELSYLKVDKNREWGVEPELQIYVDQTSKGVFARGGVRDFRHLIFMDDDIPEWTDDPPHKGLMDYDEPLTSIYGAGR